MSQSEMDNVIEVHDDGGVTFAVVGRPPKEFAANNLHPLPLQNFIGNFVWLAVVAARALGVDSTLLLHVTNVSDLDDPTFIRRFDQGFLADEADMTPIRTFIPVEVSIEPGQTDEALLRIVRDIATDVVNQGGTDDIGTTYIKALSVVEDETP